MSTLLLDYEEMEDLFDLSDQFAEYGQNLLDIYDNVNTLNLCLQKATSSEGISFIESLISNEATTTTNNKPGSVNSGILNSGSVMDKMKEFARRVGQWIIEFFGKTNVYVQKLTSNLASVMTKLRSDKTNLNFKMSNICYDISNVKLSNWLSAIQGKDRKALGEVYKQLKDKLQGSIVKEAREIPKNDVLGLLTNYNSACTSLMADKTSALNSVRDRVTKAKQSQKAEEVKALQGESIAIVNIVNYYVRFILRNTMRVLALTTKNTFSGNQSNDNTSNVDSNSADNTKDDTTNKTTKELLGL